MWVNLADERLGYKIKNKQGYEIEVVEYTTSNDILVNFIGTDAFIKTSWAALQSGRLENPYHPSVNGVGYKGVGRFPFIHDGKKTVANVKWLSMLNRCYNGREDKTLVTYKGCTVDGKWHNFQEFAAWHEIHYIEGWELDKDIYGVDSKLYSPETCCYVPRKLNLLCKEILDISAANIYCDLRNLKPTYTVRHARKYLGTYKTKEEALIAYEKSFYNQSIEIIEDHRDIVQDETLERLKLLLENRVSIKSGDCYE